MTDANFNVVEDGKRLQGNVISKHYGATNVQCTVFCVQNLKCRSYNINQAKLVCELNEKALADNGTELADDKEWQHKSTNYSSLWVCLGFLQSFGMCSINQLQILKLNSFQSAMPFMTSMSISNVALSNNSYYFLLLLLMIAISSTWLAYISAACLLLHSC